MGLFTPLALLATLASGFVTVTLLAVGRRARTFKHTGAVIAALLLYNLLVILGLTWEFVRQDLLRAVPGRYGFSLLLAILLALGYLKILWIYSLIVISRKILDRPVPPRIKPIALILGGLLVLLGVAAGASFVGSRLAGQIVTVFLWLEYLFIAAVVGVGVFLAVGARRLTRGPVRNAAVSLGSIFFLLFFLVLAGLILGPDKTPGDIGVARLANALGLLLFNLALFLWVRAYAEAFPAETGAIFHAPAALLERYGITGREIEIIALVCRGKTNREIADELCISPQTVKDHNYHIFRKAGVKNRTQLARLFMG
jgi:DNA-binding CsgD family transcriptional regulator